jgi:hypothetical protein
MFASACKKRNENTGGLATEIATGGHHCPACHDRSGGTQRIAASRVLRAEPWRAFAERRGFFRILLERCRLIIGSPGGSE